MIDRDIVPVLKRYASTFRAVALLGPRQSGKTTLVQACFPDKPYLSFEDRHQFEYATRDPLNFLDQYKEGAIFDEIQRVPDLMSYIQGFIDRSDQKGQFILTGSHNLLLHSQISQSLAGRVGILRLLPLSLHELQRAGFKPLGLNEQLFRGMYPRIYHESLPPREWYQAYIDTYVERDVRLIKNIQDLSQFQTFIRLCAGRTGQILNLSELANACGITANTAESWITILEAGYILFRLKTHHKNFNKRLIKSPKLYFYDTGLACSLLDIERPEQVGTHYLKGALFESFVISELIKNRYNRGDRHNLFFWRDKLGHEVDVLIEKGQDLIPVEIKSGGTFNSDFMKGIRYWQKLNASGPSSNAFVIYDGDPQKRDGLEVVNWSHLSNL